MRRLLAGIMVIGLVVAGCGSSASQASHNAAAGRGVTARGGPRRRGVTADAVKATPRLKRMLATEIANLRSEQPKAPRTFTTPRPSTVPRATVAPGGGTCLAATRCSETRCREFATAPAVYQPPLMYLPGGRVVTPGGRIVTPGGRIVTPGGRIVTPGGRVAGPGRGRGPACLPAPHKLVLVSARR